MPMPRINHYEILVATEYRDLFFGILDDWGFEATKNFKPDNDDEEKDISSIELKIPYTKTRKKVVYWTQIKLACKPLKILGIKISSSIMKIPKDKVRYKLVG